MTDSIPLVCKHCSRPVPADDIVIGAISGERIPFHNACGAAAREARRGAGPTLKDEVARALKHLPNWPWAAVGTPDFEAAVPSKALRSVAERWTPQRGPLLLLGPSGCGKTTAAIATIRNCSSTLTSNLGLLSLLKWTTGFEVSHATRYAKLGDEPELIKDCKDSTLLIVDEVGSEPTAENLLFEVVNARYERRAITFVTSGLTRDAFIERYGDALFRRLTQFGSCVDVWPRQVQPASVQALRTK